MPKEPRRSAGPPGPAPRTDPPDPRDPPPAEEQRAPYEQGRPDRQRLREDLTATIEALQRRKDAAEGAIEALWADCDLDAADVGSTRAAVAEEQALAEEVRQQLERTLVARRRLDDGTFGFCVSCGTSIDSDRMLAVPHTELCVSCRRDQEKHGASTQAAPPER